MLKETGSLEQSGLFDEVWLVGTWEPGLPTHEHLGPTRRVFRLKVAVARPVTSRVLRLLIIAEWYLRVVRLVWPARVAVFSAHNLAALPIGVLLKVFKGTRVVYATHELESERTGWSALTVHLARAAERRLIRRADAVFVVSQTIAQWYRDHYQLADVHLLRNMPLARNRRALEDGRVRVLRDALGLSDGVLVFLYQGVIGPGRGIDILLRTFAAMRAADRHLVFVGFSDGGDEIDRIRDTAMACENVHLLHSVPPAELPRWTADADVGIHLIEASSLSYQLAVGNKMYEYLAAGIPVIASDFPDVRQLVQEYGAGWLVRPDGSDLAGVVQSVTADDVRTRKRRLTRCWRELCWERQEGGLVSVYARLTHASSS